VTTVPTARTALDKLRTVTLRIGIVTVHGKHASPLSVR
jgi:hypothetical protein